MYAFVIKCICGPGASNTALAIAAGKRACEKQMIGGPCFMVRGHRCMGVTQDKLMVRTGPEGERTGARGHAHALTRKHAVPMAFTGKPLEGFIFMLPPGCATQRAVEAWVKRALAFVATQP